MIHIGLDTETQDGKAILICTPYHVLLPYSFGDIALWLLRHSKTYVCWNANYDIQAILKWLPESALEEIGITTRTTYKGYNLRYVPDKFFTLSLGRGTATVFDLAQYMGCSLKNAAKRLLGEDEGKLDVPAEASRLGITLPDRWIEKMGSLMRNPTLRPIVIQYCRQDAALVERIGSEIGDQVAALGLSFDRPVSCASVARQYWGSKLVGRSPRRLEAPYRDSYFGGRMEATHRGYVHEGQYWDIHSAYPAIMADLPDPRECLAAEGHDLRPDAAYASALCDLSLPRGAPAYPVAVWGQTGSLVYPWGRFSARLDADTIRVTRLLFGPGACRVREIHQLIPQNDSRPFAGMRELYRARTETPALSLALKLIMNSTYGLLAEQVRSWRSASVLTAASIWGAGNFWDRDVRAGRGTNFILAAKITGAVRAKILKDFWHRTVYLYATDGVIADGPPNQGRGDDLGAWGYDGKADTVIVGSGVYARRRDDGSWQTKFRGFARLPDLVSILQSHAHRVSIPISVLAARSLKQIALDREARWSELNWLKEIPRNLDIRFDRKRLWAGKPRAGDLLKSLESSEPWGYLGE